MKKIYDIKFLTKHIIEYLFVIFIILECNSVYSQIYNIHYFIRTAMVIVVCGIMFCDIIIKKLKNELIIHKPILWYIIFDFICCIIMFMNTSNGTGRGILLMYFIVSLPIFLIYFSNKNYNQIKEIGKKFIGIVLILSCVSFFFWLFGSVLNIIKPINEIKVVWGRPYTLMDNYCGIYFDSHQDIYWLTNSPIPRNMGIFGEAPMFACILLITMLINFLLCCQDSENKYNKKNIIKMGILVITMFSTISITGIISSIIIILFYSMGLFKKIVINHKKIFSFCCIIGIVFMIPFSMNIIDKKFNSGSVLHRNMDLYNGFNAFIKSPIIGNGINHPRSVESDYENGYGYSNAIIPIITDGGILLSILYFLPIVLLGIKDVYYKNVKNIISYIIITIIFFTTVIQYRLIMMLIISMFYLFFSKEFVSDNYGKKVGVKNER